MMFFSYQPWGMSKNDSRVYLLCLLCSFLATYITLAPFSVISELSEGFGITYEESVWLTQLTAISSLLFVFVMSNMISWLGKRNAAVCGLIVCSVAYLIIPFVKQLIVIEFLMLLSGLGTSMMLTSAVSMITDVVDNRYRGEAMAVNYAFICLGNIVTAFASGWLISAFGYRSLFLHIVPIALIIAVSIMRRGTNVRGTMRRIPIILTLMWFFAVYMLAEALFDPLAYFTPYFYVLGAILLIGFILGNRFSKDKAFDTSILRNRVVVVALLLSICYYIVSYSISNPLVSVLNLYEGGFVMFGITVTYPELAVLVVAAIPIIQLVLSPAFARMNRGRDPRILTVIGMTTVLLATVMTILMYTVFGMGPMVFLIILMIAISASLFSSQNVAVIMMNVDEEQRNMASSFITMVKNTSKMAGVILLFNLLRFSDGATKLDKYLSTISTINTVIVVTGIIGVILATGIFEMHLRRKRPDDEIWQ